jgi:hypothetical protein
MSGGVTKVQKHEGTVGFWSTTALPSGTRDEYWNCEKSLPHVEFLVYYDDHDKTHRVGEHLILSKKILPEHFKCSLPYSVELPS